MSILMGLKVKKVLLYQQRIYLLTTEQKMKSKLQQQMQFHKTPTEHMGKWSSSQSLSLSSQLCNPPAAKI
jgi:hypothetical protein